MSETDTMKKTCKRVRETIDGKVAKLTESVEKVKAKRQEQTGKPYRST